MHTKKRGKKNRGKRVPKQYPVKAKSNSSYASLMSDPRWIQKSNEIKERDGYQCKCCKSDNSLSVHHLFYEYGMMPWEYPDYSMITVCVMCHAMLTKHRNCYKDLKRVFALSGFGSKAIHRLAQAFSSVGFEHINRHDFILAITWAMNNKNVLNDIIALYSHFKDTDEFHEYHDYVERKLDDIANANGKYFD